MKKMLLVWIAAAAGLLPSLSLTVNPSRDLDRASAHASRLSADSELLDRVPASALLAVSIRNLDERWSAIRSTRTLADVQDAVLAGKGLQADVVPELIGRQSVFFLAPIDQWPFAVPIGLLEPSNRAGALAVLTRLPDVACLEEGALLWVGPAENRDLLARLSKDDGPKFPDVIPLDEIADRLPAGGLARGFVNSTAVEKVLQDSAIDGSPFWFRDAAAALAADLAAVRYVAFRRDFVDGQFTTDGLVAYDPALLPGEVRQVLDPKAAPVLIPASAVAAGSDQSITPAPFVVAAFRPESSAWMPWIRYVAGRDAHGPLRNLSFWLEEFEHRYAHSLDRDLFSVIGDQGWILATRGPHGDGLELVAIFELRSGKAIEGVLGDLFSWAGEQLWLQSFGILSPRAWHEDRPATAIGGLRLRTPLASIEGPAFEVSGRYLIISTQPSGLVTGRAWTRSIEAAQKAPEREMSGSHGTILVHPSRLAGLIGAARPAAKAHSGNQPVWDAVLGLMADSGTLRVDLDYETDAIRFHGRLPIGR